MHALPYRSYSWIVTSETSATKTLDKSAFLHGGTGIPSNVRWFFDAESMGVGEKKAVILQDRVDGTEYDASVVVRSIEADPSQRTQLLWEASFIKRIRAVFPDVYQIVANGSEMPRNDLYLRFVKHASTPDAYVIELSGPVDQASVTEDIDTEEPKDCQARYEGRVLQYYGTKYERDPVNRKRAIEVHGTACVVCGFDFRDFYGPRGDGYIEIHHCKPLSAGGLFDPQTDLVPVCSNCHRMIHRRRPWLSVEQLRQLVRSCGDQAAAANQVPGTRQRPGRS